MRNMFQEAMKKAEDEGAKVTRIIDVGQPFLSINGYVRKKMRIPTVEDIGKNLRLRMNKRALMKTRFSYSIKTNKTKLKSLKFRDRRFKNKSNRFITKYKSDVLYVIDEAYSFLGRSYRSRSFNNPYPFLSRAGQAFGLELLSSKYKIELGRSFEVEKQ